MRVKRGCVGWVVFILVYWTILLSWLEPVPRSGDARAMLHHGGTTPNPQLLAGNKLQPAENIAPAHATSRLREIHVPPLTSPTCKDEKVVSLHPFAYFFVAHNHKYACGAQTIKKQIERLDGYNKTDFIIALSTQPLYAQKASALKQQGWVVLPLCELPRPHGLYKYSLQRMRAMGLSQYTRVCHLDVDLSVVRSIHHLFDLPDTPMIATRAYWDNRPGLAGPMWIVKPSNEMWNRVWAVYNQYPHLNADDMTMINILFGHEIPNLCPDKWGAGVRIFPQTLTLPYNYMVIDSDFSFPEPYEDRDILCNTLFTLHFTRYGKPMDWTRWQRKNNADGSRVHPCHREIAKLWMRDYMSVCTHNVYPPLP